MDARRPSCSKKNWNVFLTKNNDIEAAVLNVQKQNPEFSTRKIAESCKDAGVDVGKDKVNTILKNNGIELQKAGRKKN